MKNKILIPLLILGGMAAFFSFKYAGDGNSTDKKKEIVLETVMKKIRDEHYAPRDINDTFSARVFNTVISQLDYDKRFFTQTEMSELNTYEFKIDDEINNGELNFYSRVFELFNKKIEVAEGFYKEILEKPFTFNTNEEIQLDAEKIPYAKDDQELKERWRSTLKFKVLQKYVELKKAQDGEEIDGDKKTAADKKKPKKSDKELEAEARESVAKVHERYFKRLKGLDEEKRFSLFVNAIAGTEDPHTDFFPPEKKKGFDESMSGAFFGIGAQLKEEDEGVRIVEILPGPARKQGELKPNDLILKVGQGTEEPVDIQGMEIDEVISKIKGKKGTEVRLTVKKPDGSIRVIPIIRDKVEREETFAKSLIINDKEGPVGYIYLPEFYADFSGINNGRGCAQDVAIEVEKLKRAGVKGIILDLRYNGGGSLQDVVDMAGLFIDKGPIVQVKSSGVAAHTYEDHNRFAKGVLYDGPLAIMVNTSSASASEILAAAMQDYKRAVIVGTPTYGKGTVQKVVPLDDMIDNITYKELLASSEDAHSSTALIGHLKLTVQKFYRINGGSTQLKGVTPDIVFPDVYKYLDVGERRDKAALKWDEIPAANYKPYDNPVDVRSLIAASKKRMEANPTFSLIEQSAVRVKKQEENNVYSLNEAAYRKQLEEANTLSKKIEEQEQNVAPLAFTNPAEDIARLSADSTLARKNEEFMKRLKKDIYLSETVNIINDMHKPSTKLNMGTGMK